MTVRDATEDTNLVSGGGWSFEQMHRWRLSAIELFPGDH
jgi:hypothetical protein